MIKDIHEEGKIKINALITKCDVGKTAKGNPYLSMTLQDASGILDTKYWNLTEEQIKTLHVGMVVEAVGDVIFYRNAFQLRVHKMHELPDEKITDYVRRAPESDVQLHQDVADLLNQMNDETLYMITSTILERYEETFYTYPAATKNHHNYVGGLAFHSVTMAKEALEICGHYPWLNQDLLIAGCLLHDVGKTIELSDPVLPEYTIKGNLIGHISLVYNIIHDTAKELHVDEQENVMLLEHMILSHHGKHEFGSPVLPMIPEAEVLTLLDNLDSRMFMMKQSLDATKPGEIGPRVFALENRMIYHAGKEEDQ
ncbi:3'-5' exoribonuclease YhaM family protein [Catenisphaera adipataccumulans]|jgi:3'-5' exoribonuclease|uniref:3'-5' exoribonuclease n=1 Tax=Catenisphaera adipataccumulans TaxID=700500 RepID=A0A7W8CXI5_9FIRM|nr:HD domain-containing protein [Catenisphaera adipataccumulans]MBB5183433.1 3'-5' exoribonuclease [Catenisphaera adipataccumulans]